MSSCNFPILCTVLQTFMALFIANYLTPVKGTKCTTGVPSNNITINFNTKIYYLNYPSYEILYRTNTILKTKRLFHKNKIPFFISLLLQSYLLTKISLTLI